MNDSNMQNNGIERALEGYARLITEQNKQTNVQIERMTKETKKELSDLTAVVRTIAEHGIRTAERHKQYDDRFERQGNELEHLREKIEINREKTEHLEKENIDLKKDTKINSDSRVNAFRIVSGITILVVGAIIISMLMKGGLST